MIKDMQPTAILALTADQVRALSVYYAVSFAKDGTPDFSTWARMASLPTSRIRDLHRVFLDMGAIHPDGNLSKIVIGYLTKLAKDRLQ